jgi:RNA polymerase sigma factor (sigma-70 family)
MIPAQMSAAASQITRLLVEGTISGLSDGELLERFLDSRDETAFAALVERHGPMVFCTCRGVIRDHGAAEDAFQATFLVLVCKARTIRGRDAIGGWLHRVAYRIAVQANIDATRRRRRERPVSDLLVEDPMRLDAGDDLRQIVREEVARLSEKYRLPVLLCDLEGKTHAQAASELRWGEATLRRRLAGARELLRSRLARRGVGLTTAALAATFGRSAAARISTECVHATVKAAAQLNSSALRMAIGEVVSTTAAALVHKSLRTLLLGELRTLVTVVLVAGLLGSITWSLALPGQAQGQGAGAKPKPRDLRASLPAPTKTNKPDDLKETIAFRGRVFDPDSRPVQGAEIYLVRYGRMQPENVSMRATSEVDGSFRFDVKRSDLGGSEEDSPRPSSTILARARRFAFAVALDRGDNKELTLRLARDDVPISGRIIDLEGRPVAGVTVRVLNVRATPTGMLDDWLKALDKGKEIYNLEHEFLPNRVERPTISSLVPSVTTNPDGTFHINGVGRERVATLQIEAPTIETKQFEVRTRPGETVRAPGYLGAMNSEQITIYGAQFEHVAGPTRPVEGVVRDQDTGEPLKGIMVRGEHSLGNPLVYVQSISDAEGRYRLVGLPRGREGRVLAVPPCDFPVHGSLKAALGVPRDEELPYLPVRVTVPVGPGVGPVRLDIKMKRGVYVTGKVVEAATGRPVRAYVDYFVYLDNASLEAVPDLELETFHFTEADGSFGCVGLPGPGLLAARAYSDCYVFATGIEKFKRKPERGFLYTKPHYAVPINYHIVAEISPTEGTSLTHDLRLDRGRSLTVIALGPDGKPLTDMKIAGLKDMGYWETPPPDASTHTMIALRAGKGRTLTFLNEKNQLVGQLILRGDETQPQKVTLQPWGVLTGRVVKANGDPWGECEISGVNLPTDRAKVGKDGRFRIEGLIPNQAYDLRVLSKGSQLEGFIARGLMVRPGETTDLHDVVPVDDGKE